MTESITILKQFAAAKAYRVDGSLSDDKWRLVDMWSGNPAVGPRGTPSFSTAEAVNYLRLCPDRPPTPPPFSRPV